jgi:hypothetical protein
MDKMKYHNYNNNSPFTTRKIRPEKNHCSDLRDGSVANLCRGCSHLQQLYSSTRLYSYANEQPTDFSSKSPPKLTDKIKAVEMHRPMAPPNSVATLAGPSSLLFFFGLVSSVSESIASASLFQRRTRNVIDGLLIGSSFFFSVAVFLAEA